MTQYFTPYLSARSQATPIHPDASLLQEYTSGIGHMMANIPSRASNAANGVVPIEVPLQNISIVSAYFIPQSSQAGSATNYDDVSIVNLSTDGTGTASLASKTFSAAGASAGAGSAASMVLATALSVGSGNAIGVSYASNGNGIAIVAHSIDIAYRRL